MDKKINSNTELPKVVDGSDNIEQEISEISKATGLDFSKSKVSNSWYATTSDKRIRLSDHASKFTERAKDFYGDNAIDLDYNYYSKDAIIHLINGTNPFVNYNKGDKIIHSSKSIGEVTYLNSDFNKGYVEVEIKGGRVVKYDMGKFLGKENDLKKNNITEMEAIVGSEKWYKSVPLYRQVSDVLEANGFEIENKSSRISSSEYIEVPIKDENGNVEYRLKIRVSNHNMPRGSYATADIRTTKNINEAIDILKHARSDFKNLKIPSLTKDVDKSFTAEEIALPDSYSSYGHLKEILKKQGYDLNKTIVNKEIKIAPYSEENVKIKLLEICDKFKVSLEYVKSQYDKGFQVELEHGDKELAKIIALDHLDEMPNYYEKLEELEKNNKYQKLQTMKNGGDLKYDSNGVKDYFAHSSGDAGGVLVGKRHSEGGIKAINKATGQPIEMEGGEVVITRNAVSDNEKRDFEGEMLTNREILSKINQGGGGVPIFAEGGDISSHSCACTGNKYKYGGEMMSDYDIINNMAKSYPEINAGNEKQHKYRALLGSVNDKMELGGNIDLLDFNDTEKHILNELKEVNKLDINKETAKLIQGIEDAGLVYTIKNNNHHCVEVRITDFGKKLISENSEAITYEKGGVADCGCGSNMYKKGGSVREEGDKYFQGLDYKYKNQFDLNKAIEELVAGIDQSKLTPEEKNFIAYYAGYGGLEKYGATGKGLLYEYFTPSEIAKKMWALAYKYGYKGGLVLEPSCGIGEFIKYAPNQHLVTGYEINEVSANICRLLYPESNIITQPFETIFIKNNNTIKGKIGNLKKYSLVIGNPPYGAMGGLYAGMGEKEYVKAQNYIDYFISRGLDLLESGGLLIFIIGTEVAVGGTPFLQQNMTPAKLIISEKAELIDAYRLPNGLFETTDVLTDIVVFKKK